MKVDTHMHSVYSDGTYLPEVIVSKANEEGVDLIALTDHNTVEGISDFAHHVGLNGPKALAGTEITTQYKGKEIHLLAYFPLNADFRSEKYHGLMKLLDGIRDRKTESNRKTIEKLSAVYPQLNFEGFLECARKKNPYGTNYNRNAIADYLLDEHVVGDRTEAFGGLISENSEYYVRDDRKEDLLEVVRIVSSCGGFPTVAHLQEYESRLSEDDLQQMLSDIASVTREFGVEIFHYKHKPEHIAKYMGWCRNVDANILFMAGSDCHGEKKDNRIGYPYDFVLDAEHETLYSEISENVVGLFKMKGWID